MRFHVDRGDLLEAVACAVRALPARAPVPVLGGLLLEAAQHRLSVCGHDHEASATATLEAEVPAEGRALVMGRRLLDVCRVLPEGPVEFALEGPRLAVEGGGVRFALAVLPTEEYPPPPAMPGIRGEVSGAELAAAVAQVAVAAGRDDTLPVLTGIRLDLDGGTLTLAATDRYRFAVRTLPWRPHDPGTGAEVLVPARRLVEATRSLAATESVRIALGDGALGLEGAGLRTTARLLDGQLPRLTKLFAMPDAATAVAERRALAEAVRRCAVVAERHTPVRLTFTDGSVLLEAGDGDDDLAAQRLPATLTGSPGTTVAFNPGYLTEALAALEAPYAEFSLLGPGQRALLTGRAAPDAPGDAAHRQLLMSMKLPDQAPPAVVRAREAVS